MPVTAANVTEPLSDHATRVDSTGGGTLLYVGNAPPGTLTSQPFWKIKRVTITKTGDDEDVVVEWASGTIAFAYVWDDRASLSYW